MLNSLSPRKRFLACPTPLLTLQVFLPSVQINGNLLILHSLRTISIPYNTKLTPLDFSLPFPLPHGSRVRGIILIPPNQHHLYHFIWRVIFIFHTSQGTFSNQSSFFVKCRNLGSQRYRSGWTVTGVYRRLRKH